MSFGERTAVQDVSKVSTSKEGFSYEDSISMFCWFAAGFVDGPSRRGDDLLNGCDPRNARRNGVNWYL